MASAHIGFFACGLYGLIGLASAPIVFFACGLYGLIGLASAHIGFKDNYYNWDNFLYEFVFVVFLVF